MDKGPPTKTCRHCGVPLEGWYDLRGGPVEIAAVGKHQCCSSCACLAWPVDQPARIEALIDATNAALDLGWQLYFEPYTGEALPRYLPVDEETGALVDRETGAPMLLLNRDNTPDRDAVQQIFDNEIVRDEDGSTVLADYRDDMLLALATGPKSGVLVLRMSARLYYMGALDQLALKHDKPPLIPTSRDGGYFNFFFKWPAGKTIPKSIKVTAISPARDGELHDGDLLVLSQYPDDFIGPPDVAGQAAEEAAEIAALKTKRAATETKHEIKILGADDMLLLPPTIGHWCDDMGNETDTMATVPEMEPWLQTAFGIKDQDAEPVEKKNRKGIGLKDFIAYLPQHGYIYIPTRDIWPAASVNACIKPITFKNRDGTPKLGPETTDKHGNIVPGKPIKMSASTWLDKNHSAEQMTWCPGEPLEVHGRLVNDGGWFDHPGATTFNLYKPPTIVPGDPTKVDPWLNHVHRIYPDDAEHILNFLSHPVQHPEIKINHALLLGGLQGIGKDTILEPVKRAVGPWNFKEVSPTDMMGRFNGFLKSVVLRVNEVRDLGELSRYNFYEKMKPYTASPPDVHRVDEKNLKEHDVFNVNAIVMTTNHKLDGVYLPADDRRTYVAWSNCTKEDFTPAYWNELWDWYNNGGDRNVAAYLAQRNLSGFNPKAPPFKTDAWHAIVGSNLGQEEGELAEAVELLGNPDALILPWIETMASSVGGTLFGWIDDPKNSRAIPHKLAALGYTAVVNPDSTKRSTRWRINGAQQVVYAKATLNERDRIAAVKAMPKKTPEAPAKPKDDNGEPDEGIPFDD